MFEIFARFPCELIFTDHLVDNQITNASSMESKFSLLRVDLLYQSGLSQNQLFTRMAAILERQLIGTVCGQIFALSDTEKYLIRFIFPYIYVHVYI